MSLRHLISLFGLLALAGCLAGESAEQLKAKTAFAGVEIPQMADFCPPKTETARQGLIEGASAQNPTSVILAVQMPCGAKAENDHLAFLTVVSSLDASGHNEPREETIARAAYNTRFVDLNNLDRFYENEETRKSIARIQFGGTDENGAYLVTELKPEPDGIALAYVMAFTNLAGRPVMIMIRQPLSNGENTQTILNRGKSAAAALIKANP